MLNIKKKCKQNKHVKILYNTTLNIISNASKSKKIIMKQIKYTQNIKTTLNIFIDTNKS